MPEAKENWRPPNWNKIKMDLVGNFMDITTMDEIDIGIEAVADAMLEGLKAEGRYCKLHRYFRPLGCKQPIRAPGWRVFIPEMAGGKNATNLV